MVTIYVAIGSTIVIQPANNCAINFAVKRIIDNAIIETISSDVCFSDS
jgi:hypothetical protein